MSDAWFEGWLARKSDHQFKWTIPYNAGTREYEEWLAGYRGDLGPFSL